MVDLRPECAPELGSLRRSCGAKCFLVRSGQPSDTLYILLAGILTRECVLHDGRRQIVGLYVPGDVCDLATLSNGHAAFDLFTLSKLTYLAVPRPLLSSLIRESTDFALAVGREMSREAAISAAWVVNLGQRSAYERLAYFMCELEARLRISGLDTTMGVAWPGTQSDISAALGLSLVHLNKTVRKLETDRFATSRPRIRFGDAQKLGAVVHFDSSYLLLDRETLGEMLLARIAAFGEARTESAVGRGAGREPNRIAPDARG